MDGHFVPNLSMGPLVVRALKRVTDLFLDVHLMITHPESYLEPFVDAGAGHISFHIEAEGDHPGMIEWLRERRVGCGIALNPGTPVEAILEYLPLVDMVLVMTVHPGFGGQTFLRDNLEKVRRIRQEEGALREQGRGNGSVDIEVDGGIDRQSIVESFAAGANVFVAGSSVFGAEDPGGAVSELRARVQASG